MPNNIRNDLYTIDRTTFPYVFEQNVTIPLNCLPKTSLVRCNIYRPKTDKPVPVLVTYGPYGKDIHYKNFNAASFDDLNPLHKSDHSSFETPDPKLWTENGYAVLRADEIGTGQSPGVMDTMSKSTTDAFVEVIEWAADQTWSNGKVGLLGISYFGGGQWRVAARRPKGLAAMIPYDGMADYYRDRCRHGGILTGFLEWWFQKQVISNQYGLSGKAARNWGPDTIEGDLDERELAQNRHDQVADNSKHFFRDEHYYASRDYSLEDIETPLLSVGNWGSIMIHLRGNVLGYLYASSKHKFLRMNVGRHDIPFYQNEEFETQKSFFDAFLHGRDTGGWTDGSRAPVELTIRRGNVGYNDPIRERAFERRQEMEWPLARIKYTVLFLQPDGSLRSEAKPLEQKRTRLSYPALGNIDSPSFVHFSTPPLERATEITGHSTAHLNVSVTPQFGDKSPSDIELFLTLRHFASDGSEVYYTGITGEPVPLCKGWLKVSLRQTNPQHPWHRHYLPYRDYFARDVQPVIPGEVYAVDVELWPTNVVAEQGDRIVLEVSSGDTQGCGKFGHETHERSLSRLQGDNNIQFGPTYLNTLTLPIIPQH